MDDPDGQKINNCVVINEGASNDAHSKSYVLYY